MGKKPTFAHLRSQQSIMKTLNLGKACAIMMEMAKQAGRRRLGALHPSFNLLKMVQDFLDRELPDDAHLLASGQLGISLTRVSDGKNLLVTHFDSKEELIQALVCSCFFPPFCGWMPPSFRGRRYIDGAISDNMPFWKLKNTITVSPFSGESDISPRESPFYYHEVQYNNVSLYVNFNNMYRVASVFLPPDAEVLGQMCRDGYRDTLQFLHENNLLKMDLLPELSLTEVPLTPMARNELKQLLDSKNKEINCNVIKPNNSHVEHKHHRQEKETTNILPVPIEKVISESCKEMDGPYAAAKEYVFVRVLVEILMLCILPVEFAFAFVYRLIEWAPEMTSDLQWMCSLIWDLCKMIHSGTLPNGNEVQQKSSHVSCHDLQALSSRSLSEWDDSDVPPLYPSPLVCHSTFKGKK
ncbi:patatin-like phospholipase domain-containing protein 2 isoform X2 [Sardina pilchardus]|uniref:patatin-like phospholipase domain-containing protein 2 isoform X2 n=1 Tax=Sardina pilchardus TaxID=27697 RepID=UPI002E0D5FF2